MSSRQYRPALANPLVLGALILIPLSSSPALAAPADPWEDAICGPKVEMPGGCPEYSECLEDPAACAACGLREFAVLKDYLQSKQSKDGRPVLLFDHLRRLWVSASLKSAALGANGDAVDFDVNCVPTLGMKRGKEARVSVLIFNTNSLLYSTEVKAVEEFDPKGLEQLQELAGLLGGALTTLVDPPSGGRVYNFTGSLNWIARLIDKVGNRLGAVETEVTKLGGSLTPLDKKIKAAALVGARVRSVQRDVEADEKPKWALSAVGFGNTSADDIDEASAELLDTLGQLKPTHCTSSHEAAVAAITHWLRGRPKAGESGFLDNLERLRDTETLDRQKCETAEKDGFAELATHLEQKEPQHTDPKLLDDIKELRKRSYEYNGRAERYAALRKTAEAAPAKAAAASKQMASFETWKRRWEKAASHCQSGAGDQWQCLATGVLSVFEGNPRLKWDKGQKRAFTVQADSSAAFAGDIALRRANKIDSEVQLQGRWFDRLGVGVAFTMTGVKDPTFGVTSIPCEVEDDGVVPACTPSNPAPPALRPDPTTLTKEIQISQSSEESRSGDLALLLSYRFAPKRETVGWGVEGGFGLGDDFAAFAGLSLYLGKYVRLGGGYTLQKVTGLAGNQTLGTVVPGADDIMTLERDENDAYLSLTIALDSLPIFESGSE